MAPAASSADRLGRLAAAIDELARAARGSQGGEPSVNDLAERLAAVWAMVADLDPAVAARLSGY